jgi:hypothetical protein
LILEPESVKILKKWGFSPQMRFSGIYFAENYSSFILNFILSPSSTPPFLPACPKTATDVFQNKTKKRRFQ